MNMLGCGCVNTTTLHSEELMLRVFHSITILGMFFFSVPPFYFSFFDSFFLSFSLYVCVCIGVFGDAGCLCVCLFFSVQLFFFTPLFTYLFGLGWVGLGWVSRGRKGEREGGGRQGREREGGREEYSKVKYSKVK